MQKNMKGPPPTPSLGPLYSLDMLPTPDDLPVAERAAGGPLHSGRMGRRALATVAELLGPDASATAATLEVPTLVS